MVHGMSTIALNPGTATTTPVPLRAKLGAGLALPLSLMTLVGVVIFWDWSWTTWVGVLGAAMGVAGIAGAVGVLAGRAGALELLRRAMLVQVAYTVMKLVFWQELEAGTFGAVALIVLALVRRGR